MIHYNTYLGLTDLGETVDRAVKDLHAHMNEFDSIACEGISGLIVASPVALALGKPLVICRKDTDMLVHCQHVSWVENAENAGKRVLFLDDYIGVEARTIMHAEDLLSRYTSGGIVAAYQYESGKYNTSDLEYA